MFDYLFFDLDGTLTDPALGITNSFKHAIKLFGLEIPSYETLCSFIGPPLLDTFRTQFGFDEEKANLGVKYYRQHYAESGLFENEVYDGIAEMCAKLKAVGKHLTVATSKPEHFAVQIMEHFSLSQYFDFICGSNMDESRSEKAEVIEYAIQCNKITDKSKILMIGDRKHDIIGAQKNGIKSCGILFGYGDRKEHQEAGADYIKDTVKDLEYFLLQS